MTSSGEAKPEADKLEEGIESDNSVNNNEKAETKAEVAETETASDETVNNIDQEEQAETNETVRTSEGKNDLNNNDEN